MNSREIENKNIQRKKEKVYQLNQIHSLTKTFQNNFIFFPKKKKQSNPEAGMECCERTFEKLKKIK